MTQLCSALYFFGKYPENEIQLDLFIARETTCMLHFKKIVRAISEIQIIYIQTRITRLKVVDKIQAQRDRLPVMFLTKQNSIKYIGHENKTKTTRKIN